MSREPRIHQVSTASGQWAFLLGKDGPALSSPGDTLSGWPGATMTFSDSFSTYGHQLLGTQPMTTTRSPLDDVEAAFERARDILTWPDDWDGEGSPGYAEATWDRARDLVVRAAHAAIGHQVRMVIAPHVDNGPDGSIDLVWELPDRTLLVNVPADPTRWPGYYGDTKAGAVVKGTLDPAAPNDWLLLWLTQ